MASLVALPNLGAHPACIQLADSQVGLSAYVYYGAMSPAMIGACRQGEV